MVRLAGIPLEKIERADIMKALKENNGNMLKAANQLNIGRTSLYYIMKDDQELLDFKNECRKHFEVKIIDTAEDCIEAAMEDYKIDKPNALRAALFTLNSKGKTRGWSNTNAQELSTEQLTSALRECFNESKRGIDENNQRLSRAAESPVETDKPVLDKGRSGEQS